MSKSEQKLIERFGWRKVTAPKAWRPQAVGEELVGYYGGRTLRNGSWGQYEVVIVHVPHKGSFTVSGTVLIRLIDAAGIEKTHPLRVVWGGYRKTANDHQEKQFELLVADLDAIDEADMPEVHA